MPKNKYFSSISIYNTFFPIFSHFSSFFPRTHRNQDLRMEKMGLDPQYRHYTTHRHTFTLWVKVWVRMWVKVWVKVWVRVWVRI